VKRLIKSIRVLLPSDAEAGERTKERMQQSGRHRSPRNRGHAVIEVALLSPWIFFLFVGTLDMGFYTHALIATQNAARAGAAYTSRSTLKAADYAGACQYALGELKAMSNVRSLANCNSSPLIVTASALPAGVDGSPASSVSVTYQTNRLIPIPGLAGQLNITRTVQMMVK
jgi:Flp pilus assembly protein TadG